MGGQFPNHHHRKPLEPATYRRVSARAKAVCDHPNASMHNALSTGRPDMNGEEVDIWGLEGASKQVPMERLARVQSRCRFQSENHLDGLLCIKFINPPNYILETSSSFLTLAVFSAIIHNKARVEDGR